MVAVLMWGRRLADYGNNFVIIRPLLSSATFAWLGTTTIDALHAKGPL